MRAEKANDASSGALCMPLVNLTIKRTVKKAFRLVGTRQKRPFHRFEPCERKFSSTVLKLGAGNSPCYSIITKFYLAEIHMAKEETYGTTTRNTTY
jgi:hypothetical protein